MHTDLHSLPEKLASTTGEERVALLLELAKIRSRSHHQRQTWTQEALALAKKFNLPKKNR